MNDNEYMQGEELDRFRKSATGLCWWCGAAANSQEHKFKLRNLRKLSRNTDSNLVWLDGESQREVRSIKKSQRVRFKANLCAQCNNSRSQAFDFAYDEFVDYLWNQGRNLHRARHIDLKNIYGDAWLSKSCNLARYFVKQIGCRIDYDGFAVPGEFIGFLGGGTEIPSLRLCMYEDPDLWDMHKNFGFDGDWVLGEGFGPMMGAVSPSLGRLTMFSSSMVVGYIGVMYRWDVNAVGSDSFYAHRKVRLHQRDKLARQFSRRPA